MQNKHIDSIKRCKIDILQSLKKNIQFWPQPDTKVFNTLSVEDQRLALEYFESDQSRTMKLRKTFRRSL